MSSFASQNCSSPDAMAHITKKRRCSLSTNDAIIDTLEKASRPSGRPCGKKASLSTRQEICMLRMQVASMEEELRGLHAKWAKSQLNKHALVAAQHSVREKYEMSRTLATHNQLQELFLRRQVVFATLQSAIVGAPLNLRTSTTDIFMALHFDTRLGQGTEDRKRTLEAHNERSLRTLPSIINQFTQAKVDKMLKYQDKDITKASVSPTSQIEVTGGADYTLVSSVFMTDIPHTSLHDVYAGVLAFFDSITTWLKWHLGMNAMRTRLNDVEASPAYWCLDHASSFGLPATVNQVVCSELTESLGTVHLDASLTIHSTQVI